MNLHLCCQMTAVYSKVYLHHNQNLHRENPDLFDSRTCLRRCSGHYPTCLDSLLVPPNQDFHFQVVALAQVQPTRYLHLRVMVLDQAVPNQEQHFYVLGPVQVQPNLNVHYQELALGLELPSSCLYLQVVVLPNPC